MPRRRHPKSSCPPLDVVVPPQIDRVRCALGGGRPANPPRSITQATFDYDDDHLEALADPGTSVTSLHAYHYALDIGYEPIQADLFNFAFPRVLEQYRHELLHGAQTRFPEEFKLTLARTDLLGHYHHWSGALNPAGRFPDPLNDLPDARREIVLYLAGTILELADRIDPADRLISPGAQRNGSEAIGHLSLFGIYSPTIEPLWRNLWSFETGGRLRFGILWLSCLVYEVKSNPFWPFQSPALWCNDCDVFDLGWKPANIDFLRATLTVHFVQEAAARAQRLLRGTADEPAATLLLNDIAARGSVIASRIAELPQLLALPNEPAEEHRCWTI
jgi:hypothetical protein